MAALGPVLLLAVAELVLRLTGAGYPTSFFLQTTAHGQRYAVENPKFSWRFFPPRLARTPQPLRFREPKPAATTRIFVFGESAAMGDPAPAFGFARQLEVMLQVRHPETRIEVVNVAMTAINSHVVREIARDCASRQSDGWIVYAGNNEVIGPYGAGTVFGRQAPPEAFVRFSLALKRTRLGQWLSGVRNAGNLPARWEGMELFLGQQVPAKDPRLRRVYANFRANLEAIASSGTSSGAKVLLATIPVNLKDSPPFGSKHRTGLTVSQVQQWNSDYASGREAESQGRLAEALSAYNEAAKIDDEFAGLLFARARCELAQGEAAAAQKDFARARELDTLRFRADEQINSTIREVAARCKVSLVDSEKAVARASRSGVPDDELFYDHVHLNFRGNYLLARLLLPEIERQLFANPGAALPEIASEEELARRLAFTEFERRGILAEMRVRLQQPPFSSQSNFTERDERLQRLLTDLKPNPANCLAAYSEALQLRTNDWVLHGNFARALEAAGEPDKAAAQWREVARLLPHFPEPWFQLANLALNSRNFAEAHRLLLEALNRNPASTETLNSLGLAASALGRSTEARRWFKSALEIDPGSSPARINLASMLASAGETVAAASEYKTVLALETNNIAARINLARLYTTQGKPAEAITLLEQSVSLKPDEPLVRYELGNILSQQQQYARAIPHYQAAVNARPGFAEARYNLAIELARAGRIEEALPQFAEVARLKPEYADGHFNYGIALVRQKRYPEAVSQFQATLRINPQHQKAQAALQRAMSVENGNMPPAR